MTKALFTVRHFSSKHPAFTEPSLRNLIFKAKGNGLEIAIVRLGRRVLIDEAAFFQWLDSKSKEAA